jgi:hypothetical protein
MTFKKSSLQQALDEIEAVLAPEALAVDDIPGRAEYAGVARFFREAFVPLLRLRRARSRKQGRAVKPASPASCSSVASSAISFSSTQSARVMALVSSRAWSAPPCSRAATSSRAAGP